MHIGSQNAVNINNVEGTLYTGPQSGQFVATRPVPSPRPRPGCWGRSRPSPAGWAAPSRPSSEAGQRVAAATCESSRRERAEVSGATASAISVSSSMAST